MFEDIWILIIHERLMKKRESFSLKTVELYGYSVNRSLKEEKTFE